ncbi:MAG TPA: hypothetical protein VJV79_33495 [Polyangiaceae bacterium]|nr:hypothetical protein [Polyangiaceae bacterium]
MSRPLKTVDVFALALSALMLASLAVAHFTVVPAMSATFAEFAMAVPSATLLAMSAKSLVVIEVIGAALIGAAVVCMRSSKRAPGLVLVTSSLVITFAASVCFVYALSLPATMSVVNPDADQVESQHPQ